MASLLVAVADSVFPNLDLARDVVARAGAELRLAPQPTPEAIVATAKDADAVLVTYAKINAGMIGQMKKCRIISRFGIGVDNVDLEAATRAGIVVTKVPDYCIDEVSDHAMALLLSLIRKIPFASARAHAGRWEIACAAPCSASWDSAGFPSSLPQRRRRSACASLPTTPTFRRR
jgi:D-3-phosphoglycerate dehydrogenase / 2-oxoglutarate reductase